MRQDERQDARSRAVRGWGWRERKVVFRRREYSLAFNFLDGAGLMRYAKGAQPGHLYRVSCAEAITERFGERGYHLVARNGRHGLRAW